MKKSIIIALALATTSSLTHAQEVERYDMFYAAGSAARAFISPSDGRAVMSSLNYKSTSTNTAALLYVRRPSIVTTVASNMNSSTNMVLVVDNARNGTVDSYTPKALDHVIVYNTSTNAVTWQTARVAAVLANQTNGQLRVQLGGDTISAAAGDKVYIAKSGDDVLTTIPAASNSSTPVIATDLRYQAAGYKGMPLYASLTSADGSALSGVVEYWE